MFSSLPRPCSDDSRDEQKWASCSWLLLREFAKKFPQVGESAVASDDTPVKVADDDISVTEPGQVPDASDLEDLAIPSFTFEETRRIMTRTDFIEPLDILHVSAADTTLTQIISIDTKHCVKPDSVLTLRAAQRMCAEEGFDEALDETRDRVDQIEGMSRDGASC